MLVNLNYIFDQYKDQCIAAFNVFGYEDAVSVIRAAEELNKPVILMANNSAIKHMPIPILGKMLCTLADISSIPVCVHLDHSTNLDDITAAIKAGFTSVMFDCSQLEYDENVKKTKVVVKLAHSFNVSVEGEIGSVGYDDPSVIAKSEYTEISTAKRYAEATNVDALAIAVGTVHRMVTQSATIKFDLIKQIYDITNVPLVIHGSSGVKDSDLTLLAQYGIRKINLGTVLRLAFGNTMRETFKQYPEIFDRIDIFKFSMDAVYKEAKNKMLTMGY